MDRHGQRGHGGVAFDVDQILRFGEFPTVMPTALRRTFQELVRANLVLELLPVLQHEADDVYGGLSFGDRRAPCLQLNYERIRRLRQERCDGCVSGQVHASLA